MIIKGKKLIIILIAAAVVLSAFAAAFFSRSAETARADGFTDELQQASSADDDFVGNDVTRSFIPSAGFNENLVTAEYPSVKSGDSRFVDYVPKEYLEYNSPDEYVGMQGSCTDGMYYFTAFLVKAHKTGEVLDVKLVCTRETVDDDGKPVFVKVSLYGGLGEYLYHANGMTYNSVTDEIVITCCSVGTEQYVCIVPAADLRKNISSPHFRMQTVSCRANSITYNETLNKYVVALCGTSTQFALLDSFFQVEKTFGTKTPFVDDTWKIQGICSDDRYIYLVQYHSFDTCDEYNKNHPGNEISTYGINKLRIFDWNGSCLKTVHFEFGKTLGSWVYEAESVLLNNDRLMVCFSCVNSEKNRAFKYIDLADFACHIQFCPDEDVASYIGFTGSGNPGGLFIRGISTPLYMNRFVNPDKSFSGWTAYRVEEDKWLYCSAKDPRKAAWYKEGEQPGGYIKYVYAEGQTVSKTGTGGSHVLMCAQWEDTDCYYVSYDPNGGIGTMKTQNVVFGKAAELTANTFEKTDRAFLGWNAYSPELNKWHYITSNGIKDGWFVEGLQPTGYIKWLYQDAQEISDLVYAGSHVVMCAVWDEFYIQYNSNGTATKPSGIKEQHTAEYKTGRINPVEGYNPLLVAGSDYAEGYYLYRKEMNKWRYINNETAEGGWYVEGRQPDGYEKYWVKLKYDPESFAYPYGVFRLGATVPTGEHLVLYAKWHSGSGTAASGGQ